MSVFRQLLIAFVAFLFATVSAPAQDKVWRHGLKLEIVMRDRLVKDGLLSAAFDINTMIEPSTRAKMLAAAGDGH